MSGHGGAIGSPGAVPSAWLALEQPGTQAALSGRGTESSPVSGRQPALPRARAVGPSALTTGLGGAETPLPQDPQPPSSATPAPALQLVR